MALRARRTAARDHRPALRRDRRDGRSSRRTAGARARRGGVLTVGGAAAKARRSGRQAQLGVSDGLERHPVQRRDAVLGDRRPVLRRRVADVGREVPFRVDLRRPAHVPVARDLRQDRGGRYRGTAAVAVDHRPLLVLERGDVEAVDEADRARSRHPLQRGAQGVEVGHVKAAGVDAAHAARDDGGRAGGPHHQRVELLAGLLGVLLGVVEARQRAPVRERQPLEVEQHGASHERSGQGAAARLVGSGDPARSDLPVEREQAPPAVGSPPAGAPGGASRRLAGRLARARRGLCALCAHDPRRIIGRVAAEPARGVARHAPTGRRSCRRPVGHEGVADQPLLGHRPPLPAVRALAPVVAHHVDAVLGDRDLPGQVAGGAVLVGPDPLRLLLLKLPVDEDSALFTESRSPSTATTRLMKFISER